MARQKPEYRKVAPSLLEFSRKLKTKDYHLIPVLHVSSKKKSNEIDNADQPVIHWMKRIKD